MMTPRRANCTKTACCASSQAARRNNLEFLLEVIPSKVAPVDDMSTATLIQQFYDAGCLPRLVEAGALQNG